MEWKEIIGYEGLYEVSNTGLVKCVKKKWNGKILTPNTYGAKRNYHQIELWNDGNRKRFKLHRLVAKHFIPNPNNLPNVCHKDNNPLNNSVDNLYWGTQKDNITQMVSDNRCRNQYS